MKKITSILSMVLLSALYAVAGTTVPFKILNNTQGQFNDDQIYIAIIGAYNGTTIYYDLTNNYQNNASLPALNTGANTLHKESGDWGYANIFTRLSDIRDHTIHVDHTNACRMFIGFNSPMYLHAFDQGYAGADLNNPGDPNADVRWELVEFTYDQYNVMFVNTSRVDAFQYPMGIELYGTSSSNNAYMKRGELVTYSDVINRWNSWYGSSIFSNCYYNTISKDGLGGIIKQPSKVAAVKNAGYFDSYINSIWDYFRYNDIYVKMGMLGTWKGRVSGDAFVLTKQDYGYYDPGTLATIPWKPSSTDAIEGAGPFATAAGTTGDLPVQAMFCGAINRGVIQLTTALQDWSPEGSNYFNMNTCNEYVKFFHQSDYTYLGYTYAFAYDDTFEQSSTCATSNPDHVTVTIGGFVNGGGEGGNGDQGGGSTDDVPAAPTPTVSASNVKSIFSGAYNSITPEMFTGSWGQTTQASNVYCDGDEALKWTNFNYLGIQLVGNDGTVSVSDMETLHIDLYALSDMDINIYPIALNPTDDTKKVTKHLSANQWNSFDIPLTDFSGLDFSRLGQFKFDGGSGQTLLMDNLYFYKGTGGGGGSTDIPAALTPTKDASKVKSIYSGKYSSPTLSVPEWAWQWLKTSDGGLTKETLSGDEAIHLKTFNFAAYDLSSGINASDMGYIHIDVYPVNASDVTIHINGDENTYVSKSLTAGQWNSFDIPLSDFAGQSMASVTSLKLTGANGQDADGTKDLYVDNIYFWADGGGSSSISPAPTPSKDSNKVKSILSDSYSSSGSYAEWWEGQATMENVQLASGDNAWHIGKFIFIGIEHDKMDVSGMQALHMDIYPTSGNVTLSVFPINEGATEQYIEVTATANQWNSIDIPVANFKSKGLPMSAVYQIKLTGAGGANDESASADFYLDNVYYWSGGSTDIDRIATGGTAKNGNIYSLDGRIVRRGTTSIVGLQKGIYVVNGHKVVIR